MKKINLGCGNDIREGYINVDWYGDKMDVRHNLNEYPYPFPNDYADFIIANNVVEHLDNTLDFFKEAQRILKVGGRLRVQVPHCDASGASWGTFEHKHCYHEKAIENVTGVQLSEWRNHPFKLISTKVLRGRFFKWQKRGIVWLVEKQ